MSPRNREPFLLGLLLLAALAVRSTRLDAPFHGLCELDGAIYGTEFRNLHRLGFEGTWGWPCRNPGRWAPGELPAFHLTHGPLPFWVSVLFQKLAGVGATPMPEWSIRAVPVISAALAPLLLFGIVRRLACRRRAWAAALLAAFLPSTVWFSQAASCHFSLLFLLVLSGCWAYLRWREAPSAGRLALLAFFGWASIWSLWEGLYLLPMLAAFHLFTRGTRPWRFAILSGAFFLLCAGGLWFYASRLPGAGSLVDRAVSRMQGVPWPLLLGKLCLKTALYHTLAAALLAVSALFLVRGTSSDWKVWLWLWLGWTLADVLLLRNYWFHLIYSVYPGFVFVACGAAEAWIRLWDRRRSLAWVLLLLCAAQTAWLLQRRHAQQRGYPLSQDLSASVEGRLAFGEDLLAAFNLDEDHVAFYADALVVGGIDSPAALEQVARKYPGRRFRYLATVDPAAVEALLEPTGTLGLLLPAGLRERKGEGNLEDRLRAFGISPADDPFRAWLKSRYRALEDPPFTYFELEAGRPSASGSPGPSRPAPAGAPGRPPGSRSP